MFFSILYWKSGTRSISGKRDMLKEKMGGDRDGTIEIVMRITKESGIVTETVLTSFTVKNIEQRVSVLVFSKLEIHLKE